MISLDCWNTETAAKSKGGARYELLKGNKWREAFGVRASLAPLKPAHSKRFAPSVRSRLVHGGVSEGIHLSFRGRWESAENAR